VRSGFVVLSQSTVTLFSRPDLNLSKLWAYFPNKLVPSVTEFLVTKPVRRLFGVFSFLYPPLPEDPAEV